MNRLPSLFCAAATVAMVAPAIAASPTASVDALVAKMTPELSKQISLSLNPKRSGFKIAANKGKIAIEAGNPNELAAGYGYYLRHVLRLNWSWNGNRLKLPKNLPALKSPIEVETPWKWRYAYNYCTLSYTSAFWGPKEWATELDRMAMNGINLALVQAGLEKVWQLTLKDLGYPEDKIFAFIPNPSAAAWWNMGNLEGMGGPLTQGVIDREAKLGRQIVTTMKAYGMTPVLQGFVGLVPHDLGDYFKEGDAKYVPQGEWCGHTRPIVLDPTTKAFNKVAAIWYKNLEKVYGMKPTMLGGDLFHEGGQSGDINVTEAAQCVQAAMQKAAPGSTWVLQAWHQNPTRALIDGVDKEHTLVLTLDRNMSSVMPESRIGNFSDTPWIWTELLNFGGNQGLYGSLKKIAQLGEMQKFSSNDKLQGLGFISEGTETNPLYYEYFFRRLWQPKDEVVDDEGIASWLKEYARSRYGKAHEELVKGLTLLERSVYSPNREQEGCTESIFCARPGRNVQKASTWSSGTIYYDTKDVIDAAESFIKAGKLVPNYLKQETYRYDLIDIVRQMLSDMARPLLEEIMEAYDADNKKDFDTKSAEFLDLIKATDQLLSTYPQWRFGQMYEHALAKGQTKPEKDNMAQACKRLVTTWDGNIDGLNDYSHRQLAGLMKDFYAHRWEIFFTSYGKVLDGQLERSQVDDDFRKQDHDFERQWDSQPDAYTSSPEGDTYAVATEIFNKYKDEALRLAKGTSGNSGQSWKLTSGEMTFSFDVSDIIKEAGTYKAKFTWKSGQSALQIKRVALYEGNKLVSEDVHDGTTGWEHKDNIYTIPVEKLRSGLDSYTIKADVKGVSSTDSAGVFSFTKN
jgi:alpha-N-acetylglucosaminidase